MMIKRYFKQLFTFCLLGTLTACNTFDAMSGAEEVTPIRVKVDVEVAVDNLTGMNGLTVKLDNYEDDLHYVKELVNGSVSLDDVVPGIYTISVSGTAFDTDGNEYYINGSMVNKALYGEETELTLSVQGLKVSPLVFKEMYYACKKTPKGASYLWDQFYEIYNNSSSTLYLDGLYFADLYPSGATTTLPVWPDSENYVYGIHVWRVPGNGTDYPLEPGESCIFASAALNHQQEKWNPNSPIDASSAEFEFFTENIKLPDMPATNMEHIFYKGKADIGATTYQYLTAVKGGAFAIFQVPEGETWDPVNDVNMKSIDLSKPKSTTYYAMIPIRYVLDAVECVDNEAKVSAKRIPGVLDAGCTWVGGTYNGLGVHRKLSLDENGNPTQRENGTYIYQDTNNSTDDFEREVNPMFRRFDAKMPAWNHTLQ